MHAKKKSPYQLTVQRSSAGLGLFTNQPIKKGEFIIEYYGNILTQEESDKKGGKYLFEISNKEVIDGSPRENKARYINHACRPNCETSIVKKKIYIYAKRNIRAGEELHYDYGKEYVNDHIKPVGCKCETCRNKK